MKKNNRWMKWVLEESAKTETVLPWSRTAKKQRKVRRDARLPRVKIA